ncbi:hypothetical protein A5819_003514 [Enterococcus sp. 7E2_DIV0204]|uniref:conjugal transfer protein n=1 Tax=unclassified Enterococcus TaxID=2608891 RepID=UPI000A346ED4|nr:MULTISPECIES: conjugal transfer protein [unclassified Enterococcus]OTN83964.1 hypothetical protein A5819_003514 [Enterococcus sp. 7E2_DIV0204]OTP46872.1 hypothetical protein A5884_003750 [Enterococcus sp. 7D2_DIV0200]
MNQQRPKINFDALQKQKPPTKEKKPKKQKKSKDKGIESTRDFRFERRKVGNYLTFFFYALFFSMAILLLIFNSRLGEITKVSRSKAVDTQKIVSLVQSKNEQTDTIKFQGSQFLETLINRTTDEETEKKRAETLPLFLPKELSGQSLLFSSNAIRTVKKIECVQLEAKEKDQYRLLYDVIYSEGKFDTSLLIRLDTVFKKDQLQILNVPTIISFEEKKAEDIEKEPYKPSDFYSKGEAVTESEQQKVKEFLSNFFDLYVSNNEKLHLISAVSGLEGGTYDRSTIENVVKTGEETYEVQGSYQFHFQEDNKITSFFSLTIQVNKDSFYVEKFN